MKRLLRAIQLLSIPVLPILLGVDSEEAMTVPNVSKLIIVWLLLFLILEFFIRRYKLKK